MNDDDLFPLLKQADERLQAASQAGAHCRFDAAAFVALIHRRRARKIRRRTGLGVMAVFFMLGGLSAWSFNSGLWSGVDQILNSVASKTGKEPSGNKDGQPVGELTSAEEIARLKAEMAALDAEANRALRFVELYRAAEARHEQMAAAETLVTEQLLPVDVRAELELDRAAAITVFSADSQANRFNRPDEAAESYRSVLVHFPESHWANVARGRLAQAQQMN